MSGQTAWMPLCYSSIVNVRIKVKVSVRFKIRVRVRIWFRV